MMPATSLPPALPADLIAASLLTSPRGAELHLVSRSGQRVRLPTDEATARSLAITLWRALDQRA